MKTALVVDDEPLIRRQVAETLAFYGFEEVLEAENGKAALDLATARRPLLIVMDVSMPVMDGITAAEKIGKVVEAPIVLLTGVAKQITKSKYPIDGVLRAPAEEYLEKPVEPEELLNVVATFLG